MPRNPQTYDMIADDIIYEQTLFAEIKQGREISAIRHLGSRLS